MIRKVKQRASRVGLQKCQFLFSINITQLIVSNDSQIPPNAVLNICFEKGGKISASNEIVFDMNRNDVNPLNKPGNLKNATIPIDERVELVVTMYKESASGVLQAKRGKLILRQLKRNPGLGMDAFKVIGVHMIDLHSLAQEIGKDRSLSKESILAMEPSIGCSLNAIITTKAIIKRPSLLFGMRNGIVRKSFTHTGKVGEDSDADETNSVGSIVSDSSVFSTLGATFYYEDLEDYSGKGDGIVSSQGSATSDLHFGSPERVYQNRSGKQRNSTSQQLQDNYDYNEYSSEGGESSSSSMGGVKGSRRRRSGLHVMEVAMHGSERRPIKPLSRRPSAVHSALTAESSSSKVNTTSTGVLGSTLVDISTREDVSTLTVASIGLMPPVPLADDSGDGFTDSRVDGELTYTYQQPDQQHLYDQQLESQPPPLSPSPSSVRPPLSPLDVAKDAPSSLLGTSSVAARDATRAKDGSAREVVEDSAVWATGVMDEEGWQALPSSARSKSSRTSNNSNSVSPYFANRSPYGSPVSNRENFMYACKMFFL